TRNVVLFGGTARHGALGDTWTWDGSTWTKQAPKTSPPARFGASMAYDAATGNVVLFGSFSAPGDTWTWDGWTWTTQAPARSPPPQRHLDLGLWLTGKAVWPITGVLVPPGPARRCRILVSGRRVQGRRAPALGGVFR